MKQNRQFRKHKTNISEIYKRQKRFMQDKNGLVLSSLLLMKKKKKKNCYLKKNCAVKPIQITSPLIRIKIYFYLSNENLYPLQLMGQVFRNNFISFNQTGMLCH